jgi:hypothetical protein
MQKTSFCEREISTDENSQMKIHRWEFTDENSLMKIHWWKLTDENSYAKPIRKTHTQNSYAKLIHKPHTAETSYSWDLIQLRPHTAETSYSWKLIRKIHTQNPYAKSIRKIYTDENLERSLRAKVSELSLITVIRYNQASFLISSRRTFFKDVNQRSREDLA